MEEGPYAHPGRHADSRVRLFCSLVARDSIWCGLLDLRSR